MKVCGCCKKELPITSYFKNKTRYDGLQAYCKPCKKEKDTEYNAKNREQVNNYHKEYRADNREQFLNSLKTYREKNKPLRTAIQSNRRSAKLQRTPLWLTKEQQSEIKEFYKMAQELEQVFGWKQCVDHIIPLQGRTVSGFHVPVKFTDFIR